MMKDSDEHPVEGLHGGYVLSADPHLCPNVPVFADPEVLQTPSFWAFMEASLFRHARLTTNYF